MHRLPRSVGPRAALLQALVLLLWLWLWLALPAQAQLLSFQQALSAEGGGDRFPAGAPALEVALPDDWAITRPGSAGPVWYRISFTAPAHQRDLLALQLAHACAAFELQLNGMPLHRNGRLEPPYSQQCGQPQLVTLPGALLRTGVNTLDIKLAGHPLSHVGSRHRAGGLSAPVLGPLSQLQSRQRLLSALQVTLPQALGASLVLTGGFMFVLGFVNRRDSHLAYFGVLSVAWALLDLQLWLDGWPLSQQGGELFNFTLLPLAAHAAVQFLLRYTPFRHPVVDTALPLQTAAVPLTLLLAGPERLYPLAMAWTGVLALQVAAAAAFYLHRQWPARSRAFWLMATLLAVAALTGLVELWAQRQGTPPLLVQLTRLATSLSLVLMGLRLVHQQGRALQQAEANRAQLEVRVREATAEIERNFRQLSELKIEQVTERERKRIAADLHDDLGAKLLTIVHTSESDRISTLAREALEEMRLSVRGLTGRAVRLADALGDWRAEVVSRLAQAGIEAEWSAPEDLPQTLSARAYVQTTRILREATSNIIKHSGASYCSVRCQVADGDFQLVVQDNGEGITSEPDGRLDRGHGMATMKQRAKQLQGQCLVESGPGFGTVIRLTLPLDRALENP